MPDTGSPQQDVQSDFARQRRRRALSRIASRLRFEPDDVSTMLPFEGVVAALGRRSERDLGLQTISLDSIVGSVARQRGEFDRKFRPTSTGVRGRWERIAAARRRGQAMPPIDVYRIGDLHFVKDGHHRVSVARAFGDAHIEAHVREVTTALGAEAELRPGDLPLKHHERIFRERIPLPPELRAQIQLSDEWRYAHLATLVESWACAAATSASVCSPAARSRRHGFMRSTSPYSRYSARPGLAARAPSGALPSARHAPLPAPADPRVD